MLPTLEQLAAAIIREYFTFGELVSLLNEGKDIFFNTEQGHCIEVYDKASILKEPRNSNPELLIVFSSSTDLNEDAITITLNDCKDV